MATLGRRSRNALGSLFSSCFETSRIRIEQWVEKVSGSAHWRTRDVQNVITIYGQDPALITRIADSTDPSRVFAWLPEEQYDPFGNAIRFEYLAENRDGIEVGAAFEQVRVRIPAQRYLKRKVEMTKCCW
jgi:Salmonella virulence plasmid 65kDa B protein